MWTDVISIALYPAFNVLVSFSRTPPIAFIVSNPVLFFKALSSLHASLDPTSPVTLSILFLASSIKCICAMAIYNFSNVLY